MKEFLRVVILVPALFGVLGGLLYWVIQGWAYAGWISWGLHMILSVFVWFPLFLAPYLKKKWS
jgi:hypothetical protein